MLRSSFAVGGPRVEVRWEDQEIITEVAGECWITQFKVDPAKKDSGYAGMVCTVHGVEGGMWAGGQLWQHCAALQCCTACMALGF